MGDRRPFFSRFWSSGTPASRQQPARQTMASPSRTNNSTPSPASRAESRSVNRSTTSTTNPTSGPPRKGENKTRDRQSTSSITDSTSTPTPTNESKTPDSQLTSNTTNSSSTTQPIAENKALDNQSNSNTTNPTSTTPPPPEKKTLGSQSANAAINPPNPITRSRKEEQIIDKQNTTVIKQASTEVQTGKPTATTITSPTKEPKISSGTQYSSSLQPVTPPRRTTQSRSPLQPASSSLTTPQAQPIPPSPSRKGSETLSMPQRTSQPRSPNRMKSSTNPSKESRRTTQEISHSNEAPTSASNEKDQRPRASQQVPQPKSDAAGTSSKHNEVDVIPSKPSQLDTTTSPNIDSSTMIGGHEPIIELNAKPEETKDVKEVMQATNTIANQEAKEGVNDLLTLKSGSETSTTSQPRKRSTMPNNHSKSALPIREHITRHKDVREDISTFVNQMGIGDLKSVINGKPVCAITLAGENRGASMQMGSNSSKSERPVHIHRSYKINPNENVPSTTDEEGSSKGKGSEDAKSIRDQPPEAYVNNNAQGINNSLVLNSSIIERNPGVHMVVGHVHQEPIQSTHKASCPGTGKSESNMSRIDKLTYEPTARRRCLRGLFLETSDSDPDNPKKPRRHGCRVGCQQRDKENNVDVL